MKSIEIQQFELWQKFMKKGRAPISFEIEVTARCNLNCRHCYINVPENTPISQLQEMSTEEICEYAEQAKKLGSLFALLTGGEPLLRDDFFDLYKKLGRMGYLLHIFTNATLITEEHLRLFKLHPPRDIEITVYGVTEKTFEAVTRKPGSYQLFIRAINELKKNDIPFRLKSIAMKTNFHEQKDIEAFSLNYTKDFFRMDPFLHTRYDGNAKRNKEIIAERLTASQIVELDEIIGNKAELLKNNCDTLIRKEFKSASTDLIFTCKVGEWNMNVGTSAQLRLCASLVGKDVSYDLRKGSIKDGWENFFPEVRRMRSHNQHFIENCRCCPMVNLCFWCPAVSYLETGKYDEIIPYFCEIAHLRASKMTGME